MKNTIVIYVDEKIMLMNKSITILKYTPNRHRDKIKTALKIAIAYDLYMFESEVK